MSTSPISQTARSADSKENVFRARVPDALERSARLLFEKSGVNQSNALRDLLEFAVQLKRLPTREDAKLMRALNRSKIKRAAELQGRDVQDFVISAADEAAVEAISKNSVVALSLKDQELFAKALLSPKKEIASGLREAMKRRKARGKSAE